jgi:hypothetical protein
VTSPDDGRRSTLPPVQYKGGPLEAERGPGLGCFWIQLVALAVLVVLTPASVYAGWPDWASALLLFATIAILLFAGQTIIFLLRLVAAERRQGRRRPLASTRSQTVGELEDAAEPDQTGGTASGEEREPPTEVPRGQRTE